MKSALQRLNKIALMASQRSDIVIAIFMVLAITMMIIPLPTPMVDALIGINIGVSMLILVVAFYVRHPVDFSSLPPIILLATLFRLALSITTTRLILLQADAGQIVDAFGDFVISGELVIGLVVFLIITVAQFLVITKGSERVAEVAARFVLDAMPGKQMSIDNDLRNGDIDAQQGREKRSRLERESQLYGAMDGAMKFVKGDAIAALVILFINLIGGLLIGMFKHDMAFAEALHTYSLLTAGDGLIAQIPALLISVGAGTVVTRVSSENSQDLGSEIVSQLGADDRALGLTAIILLFAAFIPGFPTAIFLALAAGLGAGAWLVRRRRMPGREEEAVAPSAAVTTAEGATGETAAAPAGPPDDTTTPASHEEGAAPPPDPTYYRVLLSIGGGIADQVSLEKLDAQLDRTRQSVGSKLGILFPDASWRFDPSLPSHAFSLDIDEVPVINATLPPDQLRLKDDPMHLDLLQIDYRIDGETLPGRHPQYWVDTAEAERLSDASIGFQRAETVLGAALAQLLTRYAHEFIGIQETRALLAGMEAQYPELVGEAVRAVSLQRMAEVFRQLLREGVSLRPLRAILEALTEWGGAESKTSALVGHVRQALARRLCHEHAQDDGVIPALVATRPLEEVLRRIIKRSQNGSLRAMPALLAEGLKTQLEEELQQLSETLSPVAIFSPDLRAPFHEWCRSQNLEIAVLAWSEIAAEFRLQSLASLALPPQTTPAAGQRDSETTA